MITRWTGRHADRCARHKAAARALPYARADVAKPADVVPHEGDGTVNEPVNPAVASLIDNSEEYELMQVKDADEVRVLWRVVA